MADTDNTKPEGSQESRKIAAGKDYFEHVEGDVYSGTVHIHHALPSPMNKLVADLSGSQRFLVFVLMLSLIEILLAFWTGGAIATIILTIAIPALLWFSQKIWLSEGYGKTFIRRVFSGIVVLIAASFSLWNPLVESFLLHPVFQSLKSRVPGLEPYQLPLGTPSMEILFIVLTGFFLVNYFFIRDTSAMKAHPTPIEKEFPEKGYKQRLKSFCGVLLDDLNKIDRETNWSAEYFTPLDAEVEMQSGNKRLKKVTNLLTAIRSDRKSRVFLVLGDPGSGKSVALRKLCRDLLQEVDKTGKVPLYINLREWEIEEEWTEENPPTTQQLYDFLLKNLKERGDVFANEFLDRYFKPMFDYGRFFIVLDSFDEIPAVLDADASSWLIDKLSDVIYKFLAGAHESRGILASRIFRKPTQYFQAKTTLEIRPFTEVKIIQTFQKSMLQDSEQVARLLFKERQEFVPIARNPFTAALIVSYAKEHDNLLPQTQAELYSDYINHILTMCSDRIKKKGLTAEDIVQFAEDIANLMFTTPEFGLEVPLEALKTRFSQYFVEDEIAILKYGRLGRLGGGEEHRFSFAHRRFQEYFVARRLVEQPEEFSLEAIPTDSRWRDALVLYCEVTDKKEATKIAEFCWQEIQKIAGDKLETWLEMIKVKKFFYNKRDELVKSKKIKSWADVIDVYLNEVTELSSRKKSLLLEFKEAIIAKKGHLRLDMTAPQYFRAIHSLRFLKDAFRGRLECLSSFRDQLADFISYQLKWGNLLSKKLTLEASGLLESKKVNQILREFIYLLQNSWIRETIIRSCRHLPEIDRRTQHSLKLYIDNIPLTTFFPQRKELLFSFSLSDGFSDVYKHCKKRVIDTYFLFLGFLCLGILSPWLFTICMLLIFIVTIGFRILFLVVGTHPPPIYKTLFLLCLRTSITLILLLVGTGQVVSEYALCGSNLNPIISVLLDFSSSKIWMYNYFGINLFSDWSFLSNFFLLIFMLSFTFLPSWYQMFFYFPGLRTSRQFWISTLENLKFAVKFFGFTSVAYTITAFLLDYRTLKKLSEESPPNRRDISKQFFQFKTGWGRLRYVRSLQPLTVTPEGTWPDGKIPNVDNFDEASTLLAQLEEKWLGLDR